VAMLLAPLGYWAGRWKMQLPLHDSRVARALPEILLVAACVVGLAAMPTIFDFPVADASLWIAAAVAVAGVFAFATHWRATTKDS